LPFSFSRLPQLLHLGITHVTAVEEEHHGLDLGVIGRPLHPLHQVAKRD
jgi:hypothetical protein